MGDDRRTSLSKSDIPHGQHRTAQHMPTSNTAQLSPAYTHKQPSPASSAQHVPTSSTAGFCRSRPSCCLSLCLEASFWLKDGLMGNPCTVTLCCPMPIFRARPLASSVATKQRSTSLWNHVLWQVVKSVTTVANLMSLCNPALQCM